MILGLDTSGKDSQIVLLDSNKKVLDKIDWSKKYSQSKLTLKYIDRILVRNKIKKSDLRAIIVNQGPTTKNSEEASFTGLKIGITIANTFGFALKIPVVGVSLANRSFLEAAKEVGFKTAKKDSKYLTPIYPKKPNIQIS